MPSGKKNVQRTKGNTRPSSSGRSAQKLLQTSTGHELSLGKGSHLGLVGFGSSSVSKDDLESTLLDDNCRVLLKKLTKKDATTKLKALQEFKSYCVNCSDESFLSVLPYWPRFFNRLCMDNERRIREATNMTQSQIIDRAKKNFAPHLKNVIGYWMLTMNDSYAPASSAAQLAFEKAFSASKQIEVLVFCKDEIMKLITENLFHLTPHSLRDSEATSADELQENYLRILTCTMFAFANLIEKLPPSENENLLNTYEVVVSNNQFWKLAVHETLLVKGAWLKIISAFTKSPCLKTVLSPYLNKLIATVFANLDESDPVVSSAAWDATLQLISTFEDCWNFINIKKLILPKLWKILKNGCFGNASVISSCLLPFMSELMRRIESLSLEAFYDSYFSNCIEGLLLRSVRSSIAEFSSFATSFIECLKYVMLELIKNKSLQVSNLLNIKLFSVVETLLSSPTALKHNVPIFTNLLIRFLSYIHLQTSIPGDASNEFQRIEKEFWNLLSDHCLPILMEYEKPDTIAIENLSCLLKSFSRCGQISPEAKIQKRIRFEETSGLQNASVKIKEERSTDPLKIDFNSPLNQFISRCCVTSLLGYSSNQSLTHLQFLAGILSVNPYLWLIRHLLIMQQPDKVVDEEKVCLTFYLEIVKSFIIKEKRKEESSTLFTSLLLTIVSATQNDDDALAILKDVCNSTDNIILLEMLSKQLNSALSEAVYMEWIRSSDLSNTAMKLARSLFVTTVIIKSERDASWQFLIMFIKQSVEDQSKNIEQLTCFIVNELLESALRRKVKNYKKKVDCNEIIFEETQLVYEILVTYLETRERSSFSSVHRILFVLFQIISYQALDESFIPNGSMESFRSLLIDKGFSSFILGIENGGSMKCDDLKCLKKCADFIKNLVLHSKGSLHSKQIKSLKIWQNAWLKSITNATTTVSHTSWDIMSALLPTKIEWDEILNHLFSLVPLKVLLNLKLPLNVELEAKFSKKFELENSTSILAIADFVLDQFETFFPQSYSEQFIDSFLGLSAVTGYCKLCLSEESVDEKVNQICKMWMDRSVQRFLPQVMKSCIGKELILQNATKLADNSHYIYTESFSILVNSFQEVNGNWPEFISDDLMANSFNLLKVRLPSKSHLSKEFCFILIEKFKRCFEDDSTVAGVNDEMIKLSICLRHLNTLIADEPELTTELINLVSLFRQNKYLAKHDLKDRNYLTEISTLLVLLEDILKLNIVANSEMWDFILCTLGTWIKICCEDGTIASTLELICLTFNVFSLLDVVSLKMKSFEENEKDDKLIVEWKEFYSDRYYQPILNLFLTLSTDCEKSKDCVLENLVKCLQHIPLSVLENNNLQPKLVSSWDEEDKVIPIKVKYLLNSFCPLLMSERREFRFGAYTILKQVASAFPRYLQQENLQLNSIDYDEDSSTARYLPGALMDILNRGSAILKNHNFEDQINLKSKVYYAAHGYLLSACLLFNIIASGPSEWKTRWASILRTSDILYQLTNHLFLIIQEEIQDDFTEEPSWSIKNSSLKRELENLSCYVYMEAVRRMPILVREWWNSLDRKTASYVDKITSRYITPKIISKDFQIVTEVKKLDNLVLLARPSVREVIATYTVEEVSFELSIQLAENHPLGPVNIQCNRCVGVAKSQWNFWMMQLTTSIIAQRNGSILDALVLWKCHVDKMFEGVEECFVCYTILGASFQLPKLGCNTCKKKFHSSCLFKWFNTSGHSTCPLCRSIF